MSEPGRKSRTPVAILALVAVVVGAVLYGIFWQPTSPPGEPRPGFQDIAPDAGLNFRMGFLPNEQGETFKINLYDHGCGVAVGDANGDGHDDIYFLNQLGSNGLFQNRGDGTFMDVTGELGVGLEDRICNGATFADYDNDGDQDLFVTSTRGGNVLFRNDAGTFRDVSEEVGVAHVGHSQTAAFFDYDNDGWLDLYVTNTAEWTTDTYDTSSRYYVGKGMTAGLNSVIDSQKENNLLYHNNRDGTFTNVTDSAGLKGRGWSSDVAIIDYDNDGWLDVFVASMFGPDQLYRNLGNGTFADLTREVLGRTSFGAIGARVFDHDSDGRLDLYVVDMHSDMWMGLDYNHVSLPLATKSAKTKFDYFFGPGTPADPELSRMEQDLEGTLEFRHEDVVFGNTLFKNLGNGRFEERSGPANLETFWPWAVASGDFDNDGHEDAFVAAGMGYPFYYWPNSLMMNQGDGTFVDSARALGVEPPVEGEYLAEKIQSRAAVRSSRCAASADFNGDGQLEIVTNNFNDGPYLFKNTFPRKNYIAVRLQGTHSNRDAIGAVVTITAGGQSMVRMVQTAGGYLSQSSRMLHFGLGDRASIERMEILWPRGLRQVVEAVEINQLHEFTEPEQQ